MVPRAQAAAFFNVWFPRRTRSITIVASPSFDELKDAELTSPNYALLDRLGDRDSVYATGKLLSRRYPQATIHLISSEDIAKHSLQDNFVIIGGPGGKRPKPDDPEKMDAVEGNEACRKFSARLASRIGYSPDCEELVSGDRNYRALYDEHRHMVRDYGVFVASHNPYLKSARIVMLHGIHTLGVLGATRVLDGDVDSAPNFEILRHAAAARGVAVEDTFECFFEVDVMHGEVACPRIDPQSLWWTLKPQEMVVSGGTASPKSLDAVREEVVAVLQVAEDATIEQNKRKLREVRLRLAQCSVSEEMWSKIAAVCRRNSSIPPESVQFIERLLNDNS